MESKWLAHTSDSSQRKFFVQTLAFRCVKKSNFGLSKFLVATNLVVPSTLSPFIKTPTQRLVFYLIREILFSNTTALYSYIANTSKQSKTCYMYRFELSGSNNLKTRCQQKKPLTVRLKSDETTVNSESKFIFKCDLCLTDISTTPFRPATAKA